MAYIEEANELMTDATGQSIATAIGNMSATSVGNLAALTTTDKTSLVGAVNEVKSGLNDVTKNSGGTSVDISGATLSEKYTFPSDGYIYVSSETDTSGINKTAITGSNGITVAYIYQPISAANDVRSLYVRKGMQFYVVQKSANAAMRFTPLT